MAIRVAFVTKETVYLYRFLSVTFMPQPSDPINVQMPQLHGLKERSKFTLKLFGILPYYTLILQYTE